MQRGDVVVVAASGDFGKPRPAVVVQSDAIEDDHATVVVCQMTSKLINATKLRVTVEPHRGNALIVRSQIMVDKPVTIRRERAGKVIGRLERDIILKFNQSLAFVVGLAD